MFKLLRNPLYIYVLGFILAFLVYTLGWSDIYPDISIEVKVFFAITFLFFIVFGLLIDRFKFIGKTFSKTKSQLIIISSYIVFSLYAFEALVENDIPLISSLLNRPGVKYKEFGIPLVHGVLVSFNAFLIAHSFSVYMSTKSKKILRYNLLLYIPSILVINRSIMVLGLLTSLFIYIHYMGRVKLKNKIRLGLMALFGLYVFGMIGNFRSAGGEYVYKQSKVTDDFIESSIPKEYYWTYLYVASPLANFQNTINKIRIDDYSFKGFLFYENLPQIISKNLGKPLEIKERGLVRIVPWLTVGTTYAKSYSYIGWYGPYFLFFSNLFVYLLVISVLVPKRSNYHITTISVLSVIILLNIFTNMLVVTGISFQLVYCIVFAFFERKKFVLKA